MDIKEAIAVEEEVAAAEMVIGLALIQGNQCINLQFV